MRGFGNYSMRILVQEKKKIILLIPLSIKIGETIAAKYKFNLAEGYKH